VIGQLAAMAIDVLADANHAVHVNAVEFHRLDRDDVGVLAETVAGIDHLAEAAAIVLHQHVGKQKGKRLVTDQLARTPHCMPKPERQLLAGEARGSGAWQVVRQCIEIGRPLPSGQRVLELELAVEMVLDHTLVAAGDEDEMLDASVARFIDHVLDQRAVDHGQHFFGHRVGGGQEPSDEPGDRKNGLANGLHLASRRMPVRNGA
jgi:hypothetical protein